MLKFDEDGNLCFEDSQKVTIVFTKKEVEAIKMIVSTLK